MKVVKFRQRTPEDKNKIITHKCEDFILGQDFIELINVYTLEKSMIDYDFEDYKLLMSDGIYHWSIELFGFEYFNIIKNWKFYYTELLEIQILNERDSEKISHNTYDICKKKKEEEVAKQILDKKEDLLKVKKEEETVKMLVEKKEDETTSMPKISGKWKKRFWFF